MNTDDLNLVLEFELAGDSELYVKGAKRIKVDGRGGLIFQDAETDLMEKIDLRALKSFHLHPVAGWQQWNTASVN